MSTVAFSRASFRSRLCAGLLCAWAASVPVALAEPQTYEIDPEHFAIGFRVLHVGYADVVGLFLKAKGRFVYDEASRTLSSGRVVVDAASVFSNHDKRDGHLRKGDFLAVGAHPEIVFEATGLEWIDAARGRLHGDLTLLGKTRPVELAVTVNKAASYPFGHGRHTLGISASTTLLRSEWGMTYGVKGGLVADEVRMSFELEAIRQ
ncbi:MAG TPA: YceI family protein [Rhodocyclaceae bacterium]|nr:YceI family protein [Rhodocyclaceae bacterium]